MLLPIKRSEENGTEETAVVLCLSPTGLSIARSLAQQSVQVYGVDNLRYEIGHFSKYVKHDPRFSFLSAGDDLLRELLSFGARMEDKPVLFIGGDQYVDFVSQRREALQSSFILAESMCPEVNSLIVNKRAFYKRCQELNVALPATYFPKDQKHVQEIAELVKYPVIVKPTSGHLYRKRLRGKKLVEVFQTQELLKWYNTFKAWRSEVVIQEVIEGPESNIAVAGLYMDADLNCRSLFTAIKSRQYPPWYGSGSYLEAKWLSEIASLSVDLMKKLEYRGICGTEFKWDMRDSTWKLMEVNCRPTLWFALTRAAGVDVVWDAYCDLRNRPNPIHIGVQNDSARWQFLVRDIISAIHFLRGGTLSLAEFVRTVIDPRNKEYAVLSRDDWGANLGYFFNTFMKYVTHMT